MKRPEASTARLEHFVHQHSIQIPYRHLSRSAGLPIYLGVLGSDTAVQGSSVPDAISATLGGVPLDLVQGAAVIRRLNLTREGIRTCTRREVAVKASSSKAQVLRGHTDTC